LIEGITRRIDWPDNDFYHASPEGLGRDALLLLGVEPNLRWRRFTSLVVELAREHEVELVVTLGALLADVPHTRPSPVTGTASDQELVERLGLQASRYEGPTGTVGVLHDACRSASLPSVSRWAAVPHYLSLPPTPPAALAPRRRYRSVSRCNAACGRASRAIRSTSPTTTRNGACRRATIGICSSCSCSRGRRPGSPGRRSCTSARATAARSRGSRSSASR